MNLGRKKNCQRHTRAANNKQRRRNHNHYILQDNLANNLWDFISGRKDTETRLYTLTKWYQPFKRNQHMKFKKHHPLKMILVVFHMAYLLFLSLGYLYPIRQPVPKWQIKGIECIWKQTNQPNKTTWQILQIFPVQGKKPKQNRNWKSSLKTSAVINFKN